MRLLVTMAITALGVQSASAESIVTLPLPQSTPSVLSLGEPAVADDTTASIKPRRVRYDAPLILSGNGSATPPAAGQQPAPGDPKAPNDAAAAENRSSPAPGSSNQEPVRVVEEDLPSAAVPSQVGVQAASFAARPL